MSEPQPTNKALWLSSFSKPLELIELPVPTASTGSVVVRVLATALPPYAQAVHEGKLPQLNFPLPLVPNPSSIARVHAVGSDAIKIKPGDLVYVDPTVTARDDANVIIMQGHHGGEGKEGAKLIQGDWRDGSLQQYQKVPLENCYKLDENRLLKSLGYTPAELEVLPIYSVAAGAILEAAEIKASETIVIGPSGGSFGGAAVELALVLGANVVALGRSERKLAEMQEKLGNHDRFRYVVMTGDSAADASAILAATPGGAGADIYNDWTPGELEKPPYLSAGLRTLKVGGRVVLSGGARGAAEIPYTYAVHKNLKIMGKWMCNRRTLQQVIDLITLGILSVGTKVGAQVATFSLEDHHEAVQHAAKYGGWRQYTMVIPNKE